MIHQSTLRSLLQFSNEIINKLEVPEEQIKTANGDWFRQTNYNIDCLAFNRRFHNRPWMIIYCRNEAEVQATYLCAINNDLPISVRAGGHDHEGECVGSNTILIDVSQMNHVIVDEKNEIARIGPGNIFKKLTSDLAKEDVMIPHGTCATVGISGFLLGGGWGPWTRKYGMACERLIGADLLLGDGSIKQIDAEKGNVPDLLWALKGGGGLSYGIVTEFRMQAFHLPKLLIRFSVEWNPYNDHGPKPIQDYPEAQYPTIEILKAWENVINSPDTPKLIGTNLMIDGQPQKEEKFDVNSIAHNCMFYGYWEGNKEELERFIAEWFSDVPDYDLQINENYGGTGESATLPYGETLMSDWARLSHNKMMTHRFRKGENVMLSSALNRLLAEGKPLPPDYDEPAPHKITSRLVDSEGLNDKGYEGLLKSLTSSLILEGNRKFGLFTYVTLGAIAGDYYRSNPEGTSSAFPYKDKQYTIQYQTWWNKETFEKLEGENNFVFERTNRAMDWIEEGRDCDIPNTSGAFISFKDSSIPTKTYFAHNYEKLISIKKDFSEDPYNHFRSRKTIL